ncbi:hypothetical protein SS05631_c17210 [Sinorhizobium sp. CCBAU 05631]|nr:hypothetical protein SS05631_c17210 [Sinorhizobium sp. CCBAU 05631]
MQLQAPILANGFEQPFAAGTGFSRAGIHKSEELLRKPRMHPAFLRVKPV